MSGNPPNIPQSFGVYVVPSIRGAYAPGYSQSAMIHFFTFHRESYPISDQEWNDICTGYLMGTEAIVFSMIQAAGKYATNFCTFMNKVTISPQTKQILISLPFPYVSSKIHEVTMQAVNFLLGSLIYVVMAINQMFAVITIPTMRGFKEVGHPLPAALPGHTKMFHSPIGGIPTEILVGTGGENVIEGVRPYTTTTVTTAEGEQLNVQWYLPIPSTVEHMGERMAMEFGSRMKGRSSIRGIRNVSGAEGFWKVEFTD